MATPLRIDIEYSVWIKTAEQQLFYELETEYGFPRATCRSLVQLMQEFIEQNYGNLRGDNQIIYHAVSKDEPPGKQLDKIKTVSVKLTISHPEDAEILARKGIHSLRQHKMMRFATESYDQGGLLVQEDLALLLNRRGFYHRQMWQKCWVSALERQAEISGNIRQRIKLFCPIAERFMILGEL